MAEMICAKFTFRNKAANKSNKAAGKASQVALMKPLYIEQGKAVITSTRVKLLTGIAILKSHGRSSVIQYWDLRLEEDIKITMLIGTLVSNPIKEVSNSLDNSICHHRWSSTIYRSKVIK